MEGQELRHVRSPLGRAAHPPWLDWTGLDWSGGLSYTSPRWAFGPDQPRGHLEADPGHAGGITPPSSGGVLPKELKERAGEGKAWDLNPEKQKVVDLKVVLVLA